MTNFRLLRTERVCRRQFQIDENGRKLSKWVENAVEKGEIAVFKRLISQGRQKVSLCGNGLNTSQMMGSVFVRLENILVKGENARYQQFLLFKQCL